MMTADRSAIGTKFGMTFVGKWVWEMKDYIDLGFMKLFDPNYLYEDYKTKGIAMPLENNELFDTEKKDLEGHIGHLREKVKQMGAEEAAKILSCGEEEADFHERFMVLTRMHDDKEFTAQIVSLYKPPYY